MVLSHGRWAILASAGFLLVGAATIAPAPVRTISVGQTVAGTLAVRAPQAADENAHFDCYALNGGAGQSLTVKLNSVAFAPKISVGRGASCGSANYQYIQTGPAGSHEVFVTFMPAPGRYMVMVQSQGDKPGGYTLSVGGVGVQTADAGSASRREIMEAQIGKRRAEVAAEEERRQEEARIAAERQAAAEAERARIEAENAAAAAAAAVEEDDDPPPQPVNLVAAFTNSFNNAMAENARAKAQQQAFLDDLAAKQREAQRERAQRAEDARRLADERAGQARNLAAANAAQRAAAAQDLARRQQQQLADQNRRLELQRQQQQQAAQQRQQQLAQLQAPSKPLLQSRPKPVGAASTDEDPGRCVARPTVSPGKLCKGAMVISTINGCSQPVDIRLCLRKEGGAWDCGTHWGVKPQAPASFPVCAATSEVFWSARSSSASGPLASPN